MSIVFNCTCGRTLKGKEESAGKRTKCPYCGAEVTIPATSATAPASAQAAAKPGGDGIAIDAGLAFEWVPPTAEEQKHTAGAGSISSASIRVDPGAEPLPQFSEDDGGDGSSRRYKVLMPKDMGYTVKFDAAKIELALNRYARDGWILKSAFVVTIGGHAGNHDEAVFIMEK